MPWPSEYTCRKAKLNWSFIAPIKLLIHFIYPSLYVSTEPPSLTVKPKPQHAKSNGVASFYCGARGDPRPTIYWRKNSKKVSTSLSRYEIVDKVVGDSETGSVLRIEPTRAPRDNAVYECFAENGVGDAVSANAKLEVYDGEWKYQFH